MYHPHHGQGACRARSCKACDEAYKQFGEYPKSVIETLEARVSLLEWELEGARRDIARSAQPLDAPHHQQQQQQRGQQEQEQQQQYQLISPPGAPEQGIAGGDSNDHEDTLNNATTIFLLRSENQALKERNAFLRNELLETARRGSVASSDLVQVLQYNADQERHRSLLNTAVSVGTSATMQTSSQEPLVDNEFTQQRQHQGQEELVPLSSPHQQLMMMMNDHDCRIAPISAQQEHPQPYYHHSAPQPLLQAQPQQGGSLTESLLCRMSLIPPSHSYGSSTYAEQHPPPSSTITGILNNANYMENTISGSSTYSTSNFMMGGEVQQNTSAAAAFSSGGEHCGSRGGGASIDGGGSDGRNRLSLPEEQFIATAVTKKRNSKQTRVTRQQGGRGRRKTIMSSPLMNSLRAAPSGRGRRSSFAAAASSSLSSLSVGTNDEAESSSSNDDNSDNDGANTKCDASFLSSTAPSLAGGTFGGVPAITTDNDHSSGGGGGVPENLVVTTKKRGRRGGSMVQIRKRSKEGGVSSTADEAVDVARQLLLSSPCSVDRSLTSSSAAEDSATAAHDEEEDQEEEEMMEQVVKQYTSSGVGIGAPGVVGRIAFTAEMDQRLCEAVDLFGTRKGIWPKIAEYVGNGVDSKQVNRRWRTYLDPAISDLAKGGRGSKWTPEEDQRLLEFVAEHEGKSKLGSIDWTGVEFCVGRLHAACRVRLRDLREKHMKRGPFTSEEDSVLKSMMSIWNNKGGSKMGMWKSIGERLGRPPRHCQLRWVKRLAKREGAVEEMMVQQQQDEEEEEEDNTSAAPEEEEEVIS